MCNLKKEESSCPTLKNSTEKKTNLFRLPQMSLEIFFCCGAPKKVANPVQKA